MCLVRARLFGSECSCQLCKLMRFLRGVAGEAEEEFLKKEREERKRKLPPVLKLW